MRKTRVFLGAFIFILTLNETKAICNAANNQYWSEWGGWSSCDRTCGGGYRVRVASCYNYHNYWWRNIGPTGETKFDRTSCNDICINGTYINGNCTCNSGYRGICCEIAPVCTPQCENNGICIDSDTCKCPPGFYGPRCEIGRNVDSFLKPQLHASLDPDAVFKPLSWYDDIAISESNRACFVKIQVQNGRYDTVAVAYSLLPGNGSKEKMYGNYSTAPLDEKAELNGTTRFACLQVRCPGWDINGSYFDVKIVIGLKSRYSQNCTVRPVTTNQILNATVSKTNSSDHLSFTLQHDHNYGSRYGVYIATGFRNMAVYRAQHACFSGRHYDFIRMNSQDGLLAEYTCV